MAPCSIFHVPRCTYHAAHSLCVYDGENPATRLIIDTVYPFYIEVSLGNRMGRPLNVLLVEDSEDDATLMIRELERGGYDVTCKRVETSSAMEKALNKRKWDIVIADHNLPDFSAPAALSVLQKKGLDLPFIIVSGAIREDVAVEVMKAGAHDYIAKGNMARLVPAVGRELREANGRQQHSRAEDKLRKLSRAVEHSPAVVVITDTKGNIEYVNPKFTQVTGYTSEEAIGQNPRILKSGKTPPEVYKGLWETIGSGGEWHGEFCNKKRNGELYWEDVSISPVRDPDGVITNFVAVKEDITERKRTEEELKKLTESLEHRVSERTEELQRMLHELGSQQEVLETRNLELQELQQVLEESRNRYADLYDFSPVGYITLDGKGYIREINLTGVELLDREISELVDSRFANFVDNDSTEVFKKHLRRCRDSSDEVTTEMALKAKGGTIWVHLLSIPFHDKVRQATMYRTAITDITERKRMEEEMRGLTKSLEQRVVERTAELKKTNKELKTRIAEREKAEEDMKKSHNLLSSVVEGTTDAVFVKDLEGRILMINSAGAGIFGGAVEEVTGKDNSELFPPDIAREMTKHDHIVMDSGETEVFEEAAVIKGVTHTFLSTKGPYRDSKGNVIGVIGIARDITERKQAEEELRQSREGLARAQQIASLGSWEWDVVRDESHCSDETCRILGMKPQGIFSYEVFLNCVHPDDRKFVKKSVDAARDKKKPYSIDYRVVHPESTERTVHAEGEVVYDETGRPLRMIGTVQDITDRKRA
ncbi:MAG: PAS domain S-box protein, partial [Candidatus Brocadiales bacterium]